LLLNSFLDVIGLKMVSNMLIRIFDFFLVET
jgi:hypothetical protein